MPVTIDSHNKGIHHNYYSTSCENQEYCENNKYIKRKKLLGISLLILGSLALLIGLLKFNKHCKNTYKNTLIHTKSNISLFHKIRNMPKKIVYNIFFGCFCLLLSCINYIHTLCEQKYNKSKLKSQKCKLLTSVSNNKEELIDVLEHKIPQTNKHSIKKSDMQNIKVEEEIDSKLVLYREEEKSENIKQNLVFQRDILSCNKKKLHSDSNEQLSDSNQTLLEDISETTDDNLENMSTNDDNSSILTTSTLLSNTQQSLSDVSEVLSEDISETTDDNLENMSTNDDNSSILTTSTLLSDAVSEYTSENNIDNITYELSVIKDNIITSTKLNDFDVIYYTDYLKINNLYDKCYLDNYYEDKLIPVYLIKEIIDNKSTYSYNQEELILEINKRVDLINFWINNGLTTNGYSKNMIMYMDDYYFRTINEFIPWIFPSSKKHQNYKLYPIITKLDIKFFYQNPDARYTFSELFRRYEDYFMNNLTSFLTDKDQNNMICLITSIKELSGSSNVFILYKKVKSFILKQREKNILDFNQFQEIMGFWKKLKSQYF